MRSRFAAAILVVSMTGCASQPVHSKTVSKTPLRADNPSGSAASVARRVTLPYTFTRHGVEIRVTSIEFADNRIGVNATFQETRGQTFEFPLSTLIQTLTTTGAALSYAGYGLAGKTRTDPEIPVAAHDQLSITLYYQPPPGNAGAPSGPYELRFPTGKYWTSQAE